jgi:hypothetical protein
MRVRTVQRLLGLVEQDAVEFRRGLLGEGRTYGHSCALQAAKGVNGETVRPIPSKSSSGPRGSPERQ